MHLWTIKDNKGIFNLAQWLIIIINIKGQMGNRTLQNVRKRRPITIQAGGNYVTSTLDMIGSIVLQIPVTFSPFVFS